MTRAFHIIDSSAKVKRLNGCIVVTDHLGNKGKVCLHYLEYINMKQGKSIIEPLTC